jgi:chromosome segregation ATPase
MSDYAKFVRAVASSTRDSAMDDLLEENRILQERNVNLEERNGRLDAELVSAQQDARALQQRLVLSASALQQQTDRLESLESAVDNVQAQVTTKNIRIIDMEHELRAKQKELNNLKHEISHKNLEIIHKDTLLSILETDRETMQTIKGLGHKREIRRLQGLCLCGFVFGVTACLLVSNDFQTTQKTLA